MVEKVAAAHLGINDISLKDYRDVSVSSIKIALMEALKVGERLGYAKGYRDAKTGYSKEVCNCKYEFTD